jgi:hypothetical protein
MTLSRRTKISMGSLTISIVGLLISFLNHKIIFIGSYDSLVNGYIVLIHETATYVSFFIAAVLYYFIFNNVERDGFDSNSFLVLMFVTSLLAPITILITNHVFKLAVIDYGFMHFLYMCLEGAPILFSTYLMLDLFADYKGWRRI